MTTNKSTDSPDTIESVRSDYAEAVNRLQRIVRELAMTQVTDHVKVRKLVDKSRQALQTIVNCADPAVLDAVHEAEWQAFHEKLLAKSDE